MDTSSPLAMTSFSLAPRSEPEATSSRKRSPEDRWQKPNFSTILAHCVPFPLPGPPINCQVKENFYKELDKCDICLHACILFYRKMGAFLQYISYLVLCDCFPLRPQVYFVIFMKLSTFWLLFVWRFSNSHGQWKYL